MNILTSSKLRVCLVEWILRRIGKKKKKKNEEGKLFGGCLVERGKGENNGVADLDPPKSFLSKMERKLGGGKSYG